MVPALGALLARVLLALLPFSRPTCSPARSLRYAPPSPLPLLAAQSPSRLLPRRIPRRARPPPLARPRAARTPRRLGAVDARAQGGGGRATGGRRRALASPARRSRPPADRLPMTSAALAPRGLAGRGGRARLDYTLIRISSPRLGRGWPRSLCRRRNRGALVRAFARLRSSSPLVPLRQTPMLLSLNLSSARRTIYAAAYFGAWVYGGRLLARRTVGNACCSPRARAVVA